MLNPFKDVKWKPGPDEKRKLAKSLAIGCPVVGLLLLIAVRLKTGAWGFQVPLEVAGIGLLAAITFLLLPELVRPFYVLWYFLACCIGFVVGNLILALLFYVGVTGIGIGRRVFSPHSFRKGFDKQASTYWRDAEQIDDPARYYRQF